MYNQISNRTRSTQKKNVRFHEEVEDEQLDQIK